MPVQACNMEFTVLRSLIWIFLNLRLQILEKVYVQFKSFLEDPQYKDQHELQATMIRTFGKVAPHAEPHFRDEGRLEFNL